jgi:pyruvate/2-oxoglutarate dehydrogenase complex dihydrolipoamide acyltransferase (E2) component
MTREVKIPKWGLMIDKMTIVEWFKTVGDRVEHGDALCEVETDKANSEIDSPSAGTLVELRGHVGINYRVGDVIAVIETED